MDNTFLQERINSIKLQIVAYEDAILQLGTNGVQSYKLDTGQTVQWVTKLDLAQIQTTLDSLMNNYSVYCARLTGSGTVIGVPAF